MRVWYLSHMRATKGQMSLHMLAVSPQPLLLALKKRSDVDEGSGPILFLLRRWFDSVDSVFNVPPIGLWGLRVWSLFCYALMSVLSCFANILSRKR